MKGGLFPSGIYQRKNDGGTPMRRWRQLEVRIDRRRMRRNRLGKGWRGEIRGMNGGLPAAQAPLGRRHIDSSGKSLQNGRRQRFHSFRVYGVGFRLSRSLCLRCMRMWTEGWGNRCTLGDTRPTAQTRRVINVEGIELLTGPEGAAWSFYIGRCKMNIDTLYYYEFSPHCHQIMFENFIRIVILYCEEPCDQFII